MSTNAGGASSSNDGLGRCTAAHVCDCQEAVRGGAKWVRNQIEKAGIESGHFVRTD